MNRQIRTCIVVFLVSVGMAHAQDVEWVQHLVAGSSNFVNGIHTDPDGDYYITGYFGGPLDFGGQSLNGAGSGDIFIAKYSSSRKLKWAKQGTSSGWNGGRGVAADSDGNVYVSGRFQMQTTFDGITKNAIGANDVFVAMYSPDGVIQWVSSGGGGSDDWSHGISVDANGNSYATGYITGSATFDGTSVNGSGGKDMFIASYSPTGALRWVKSGGGAGDDDGIGVAAAPDGGTYVVGKFVSSATFGGSSINGSGASTGFVAKYADDGSLEWVRALSGTVSADRASIDGSGNVFVIGAFAGNATFGSTTLNSAGQEDIYVAKIDADGNAVDAWRMGGSGSDGVGGFSQVIAKEDGGFFLASPYENSVAIGEATVQSAGNKDILIAQFDAEGTPLWAQSGGGSEFDGFVGIGVDDANNSYVIGNYFSSSFKIGSFQLPRFGGFADMFVAKISGSGGSGGIPVVSLSEDALDFGDIPVGSSERLRLVVNAGSNAPLTVQNVYLGDLQTSVNGFTITEPTSDAYPQDLAGTQRLFITIEFEPTAVGAVESTVTVETNDPAMPKAEVIITGNGVDPSSFPTANFSTKALNIGEVAVGTEKSGSFTISPANPAGLVVESLEFEDPSSVLDGFDIVSPTDLPVTLNEGQSLEVVISFTADIPGKTEARLVVETNDATSTFTNVGIVATGAEAPVAQFSTFEMQFGEVRISETKEETMTITSSSAGTLRIANVEIVSGSADEFRVVSPTTFPIELGEGQATTITVEYAPTKAESVEAELHVETNDPLLPLGAVTLQGTGNSISGVDDKLVSKNNVAVNITPNPLRSEGEILIDIPIRGEMTVDVLDLNGKGLATLFNGWHEGGIKSLRLDASLFDAGTYICTVEIEGKRYHRVVTVLR